MAKTKSHKKITPAMSKLLASVGSNNHDSVFAKLKAKFKLTEKEGMNIVKQFLKEA